MFCGPETVDVSRGEAEGNSTKHTAFPRSQSISILLYTKSQRNKKIQRYMKYFINFLKNVKFNAVHNVIHKTFAVFGCPKVACSCDGARERADASLISSISRDTPSTNKTHEKENFDNWYIITIFNVK